MCLIYISECNKWKSEETNEYMEEMHVRLKNMLRLSTIWWKWWYIYIGEKSEKFLKCQHDQVSDETGVIYFPTYISKFL